MVARRIGQILADAEIPFRGLDGCVTEGNLNLFECRAAAVRELGEAAAGIMRREPDSHELAVVNEDLKQVAGPLLLQGRSGVRASIQASPGSLFAAGDGDGQGRAGDESVLGRVTDDQLSHCFLPTPGQPVPRRLFPEFS